MISNIGSQKQCLLFWRPYDLHNFFINYEFSKQKFLLNKQRVYWQIVSDLLFTWNKDNFGKNTFIVVFSNQFLKCKIFFEFIIPTHISAAGNYLCKSEYRKITFSVNRKSAHLRFSLGGNKLTAFPWCFLLKVDTVVET